MDFRLFVDEVGNGDLKGAATDPNIRYLSLTGVLTRLDLHDRIIQPQLDTLKTRLFGHTPDMPVVLHRRELVRKEGPFSVLRDPGVESDFNQSILQVLECFPYLAITVMIDKRLHLETYSVWRFDPYHYCMRCLIERYVMYLRSHSWRGDVMVEARSKTPDKKLKSSFELIYNSGTDNISPAQIQNVLTTKDIQMKPKTANVAGLQIADLIAHPSARAMRLERDGLPPLQDFGGRVVDILLRSRYRRHPTTSQINGFGRKWLP
jgi:Protein of unknown function (DUF3800)